MIPKKLRDNLGITQDTLLQIVPRGEGIYIYPIEGVLIKSEGDDNQGAYLELLKKTQGILGSKPYYKNDRLRRKIELRASAKRKAVW